ncbi:MAG: hypothetical protein IKM60_02080 [Clostridia bacterium]|nr:hypothetical protein [Clostridia bacterium]
MEYLIGMQQKTLEPLLRKYLNSAVFAETLCIREVCLPYIRIYAAGHVQTVYLAEILAEIVVEYLQMQYLKNCIRKEHGRLSYWKQRCIRMDIVREIWTGKEKGCIERQKEEIAQELTRWLLSEKTPLMLDGFWTFRCKTIAQKVDAVMHKVTGNYTLLQEQEDLVRRLQSVVQSQKPSVGGVYIERQEAQYILYDAVGRQIRMELQTEMTCTEEERLILGLVYLSPAILYVKETVDPLIVRLLYGIFPGRVYEI